MTTRDDRPADALTDRELLERVDGTLTDILRLVENVVAEVKPTLDALTSHPMFKMLLPKGK